MLVYLRVCCKLSIDLMPPKEKQPTAIRWLYRNMNLSQCLICYNLNSNNVQCTTTPEGEYIHIASTYRCAKNYLLITHSRRVVRSGSGSRSVTYYYIIIYVVLMYVYKKLSERQVYHIL